MARASHSVVLRVARHYFGEMGHNRFFVLMTVAWIVATSGGVCINSWISAHRNEIVARETASREKYYSEISNYALVFMSFYTLRRPSAPLSPFVGGVEYLAPTYVDYRPRFSPSFYYGDDIDPLMRFFVPPDLTACVGLAGLLILMLLCFDAVNGEIGSRNAMVLSCFDVTVEQIYFARVLSLWCVALLSFGAGFVPAVVIYFCLTDVDPGRVAAQLVGLFGVCALYLLTSTALFVTVSTFVRRAGAAFFASFAVFVSIVYFNGFVIESTVDALSPQDTTAHDLIQDKVLFSRKIHHFIDEDAAKLKSSFTGMPPNPASISDLMRTSIDLSYAFVIANSEGSLRFDRAYFRNLEKRNTLTLNMIMLFSPYVAFSHALSVLADTSIVNEFAAQRAATDDFFLVFRDWWLAGYSAGTQMEKVPVEKWIFAPPQLALDFHALGSVPEPTLAWSARLMALLPPVLILSVYGFLLVALGRWKARRIFLVS